MPDGFHDRFEDGRNPREDLADNLFEMLRVHDVHLALDALGMTLIRVLLESTPVLGKTHREILDNWLNHVQTCGKHL